jgi:hypothetical protein
MYNRINKTGPGIASLLMSEVTEIYLAPDLDYLARIRKGTSNR